MGEKRSTSHYSLSPEQNHTPLDAASLSTLKDHAVHDRMLQSMQEGTENKPNASIDQTTIRPTFTRDLTNPTHAIHN